MKELLNPSNPERELIGFKTENSKSTVDNLSAVEKMKLTINLKPLKYNFKILESKIEDGNWRENREALEGNWREVLAVRNEKLLVYNEKEICLVDGQGDFLWEQELYYIGTDSVGRFAIPNAAWISGNRLLVTTNSENYHSWGHLGPAFLLDLTDGRIIKELKGNRGVPLSGGRFLLGLEGYDIFDTWLYGPDGNLLQEWRSCGYYMIGENDDIRVVEQDRQGWAAEGRVVRLKLDGTIEKGIKLIGSSVSVPAMFENGDIIFQNVGLLRIVDRNLSEVGRLELIDIPEKETYRFHEKITLLEDSTIKVEITERSADERFNYKTHEWLVELNIGN